jgi:hypothetical protein
MTTRDSLQTSSDHVKTFRRFLDPGHPCLGRPTSPPSNASPSTIPKAGRYVLRYGLVPHDHINPVERAEGIEMHLTNYLRQHR